MVRGRHVGDVAHVAGKAHRLGIQRAAQHEALLWQQRRRGQEQLLQLRLAIAGIRAQVRELRAKALLRRGRPMRAGIHKSIQRLHAPRAEAPLQQLQCLPAGEAQHQIEVCKTTRAQVAALLGKPNGEAVYPMVKDRGQKAVIYSYGQAKGSVFNMKFHNKLLLVSFDAADVVADVTYTSNGEK